jgi:hypothetical protein
MKRKHFGMVGIGEPVVFTIRDGGVVGDVVVRVGAVRAGLALRLLHQQSLRVP